ncbi:MAG: hypothetical protein EZS28_039213 [Streblomastix strix]|uniref:Uncharacterized protein n=1 Tax=Streblomastix strix TaxID=222440 RepID=A0A5J4U527_9EUKA|nr:MAG: hypothetical protein EZS28_039213 [Streblomastix strix]
MLAQVALTVPMSPAWAERGISLISIIKTDLRSKLTERMLSFLMNIKIDGPIQLSDDDAKAIANIWIKKKERRNVNYRQKQQLINKDSQIEVPDNLPVFADGKTMGDPSFSIISEVGFSDLKANKFPTAELGCEFIESNFIYGTYTNLGLVLNDLTGEDIAPSIA